MAPSSLLLSLLTGLAAAFPQNAATGVPTGLLSQLTSLGQQAAQILKEGKTSPSATTFNAASQLVDVSGLHEFQPPGPTDQRGPCPGLNALANHGYLPRSGVALIPEFVLAVSQVYNMGIDLGTILGAYGGVFNGDLLGWSIGGDEHTGIAGSHNNYEGDSSPTRGDLYQDGTNTKVIMSYFKMLLDMQPDPATANYDLNTLMDYRPARYNISLFGNPDFYLGPFTGFVGGAAHVLIPALFSNHSEENPDGTLNQDVLKSFFAITGNNNDLVYKPGHERIPYNWYRRSSDSPYGFESLANDITTMSNKYPQTAKLGCNMGKVNTFTPLNTSDTSLSAYDFTKPTDNVCYAMALIGSVANSVPVAGLVEPLVALPIQNALDCPTVPSLDSSVGKVCPGYSFYGGPTAPIAPGAIQDPSS